MLRIFSILVLSLFFISSTNAGSKKDKEIHTININNKENTIKADVSSTKGKVVAVDSLTYYWHAYNKIMETKGGFDGKLLNGNYTVFYINNNLKEKGKFKNGLKNGKWILWYDSGKIQEISCWKNGIKEGAYQSYDMTGQQVLDANFKSDKLEGIMISYQSGKILSRKAYKAGIEIPLIEYYEKQSSTNKLIDKIKMIFRKKEKKDTAQENQIAKETREKDISKTNK